MGDDDGQERFDGRVAIALGRPARAGDHGEAAAFFADEVGNHLELGVRELAGIDIAHDEDVVVEEAIHRFGEGSDAPGIVVLRAVGIVAAFLAKSRGAALGEEATHLDRFVAEQAVF